MPESASEPVPESVPESGPEPVPEFGPESVPESGPSGSGVSRLWAAATARPSRSQLVAALLLALLGYAATVQIQLTHASTDFAGQRRNDLVELLDSLSGASDRVQQQISSLQDTRDELLSSSNGRAAVIADTRRHLLNLQILAGTVGATGPGVTVTVSDPEAAVTPAALLNGIEELRDAGAEAIQINDTRVVAESWIAGSPGAIIVDGQVVEPPYVITAIGSAHTLSDAVVFPGGLSDEIESLGGKVAVQEGDAVVVDALHPLTQPQYSQPTGH